MIWLLLTGTVKPHNADLGAALSDASARRAQYEHAVDWWARAAPASWQIVFAENSGERLQTASSRIDLMDVPPPQAAVRAAGKGAMESDLILSALRAIDPAPTDQVVKCTGRLIVPNIGRLGIEDDEHTYCRRNLAWSMVDTRLIASTASEWSGWGEAGLKNTCDRNGRWLEHVLAEEIRTSSTPVRPFAQVPTFAGSSGQSGLKYRARSPLGTRATRAVVTLLERQLERLWI